MSRLSEHRQKQFLRKLLFLVIGLIALGVFMVTIGFKLLINSSLMINRLTSGEETDQTQNTEDFFGSLEIDDLPIATNSAELIISGSVTNYDTVEIYINREKVKQLRLTSDSFSEEVGDLRKGENVIYVKARASKEKKEEKTDSYSIQYISGKPKLEIKEPQENTKTSKSEIKVAGTANKDDEITVNNSPVVLDQNGNFETTVNLKEGDNTIEVEVEDIAGNIEKKSIKVTYQKE